MGTWRGQPEQGPYDARRCRLSRGERYQLKGLRGKGQKWKKLTAWEKKMEKIINRCHKEIQKWLRIPQGSWRRLENRKP